MLNAFSRDIRSISAQENIGVHLGAPLLVEHFPKKVILTLICMVRSSPSVYGPISKLIRGPTSVRLWHKADITRRLLFVHFSNRPSGSSTFRLTTNPVSMSLTGSRFSSDSAPRPFHHGDSKTRWNNLSGGLAVNMTAGPSGQMISPHPSSREGHHSTARWSSISSYRISS